MPPPFRLPALLAAVLALACESGPASAGSPGVSVAVTPRTALVAAGGSQAFTAAVSGTANAAVTWSIEEGAAGGTITSAGLYGAPATGGVFHVVATSAADPSRSDSATVTVVGPGPVITPGEPGGDVAIEVDTATGGPISRWIYGLNIAHSTGWWGTGLPRTTTLSRFGGNNLTPYNWETSAYNNGADVSFSNVRYPGGATVPGGEIATRADHTFARPSAMMITAPVAGWVAADWNGTAVPIPTATSTTSPATPDATRFFPILAKNPTGATATPLLDDGRVYVDDLVKWFATRYPHVATDASRPLFVSLDNEPDLWGETHPELRGRTAAGASVETGYQELVDRSVPVAAAVKDVLPQAKVLGPALATYAGYEMLSSNVRARPAGHAWFIDFYLAKMREQSEAQGRRLLDVLDVHFYSEATSPSGERVGNDYLAQSDAVIQARVQAPRSLWDPTFTERSWVANVTNGPIRLIPRLKQSIAAHYPGTGLAITEYYYGRGGDISGGIAQADALGIFGREGVFAATLWPNAGIWSYNTPAAPCSSDTACATLAYQCVFAAFNTYLDYDGSGARFGDTSAAATTSDRAATSVHASVDAGNPDRVLVLAINKATTATSVGVKVHHSKLLTRAETWRVTARGAYNQPGCTGPTRGADVTLGLPNAFAASLPPMSWTLFVLRP